MQCHRLQRRAKDGEAVMMAIRYQNLAEPGVQWCDICAEDCQIRRSYVSECGDGVHQINEECDPTANNFHARLCRVPSIGGGLVLQGIGGGLTCRLLCV